MTNADNVRTKRILERGNVFLVEAAHLHTSRRVLLLENLDNLEPTIIELTAKTPCRLGITTLLVLSEIVPNSRDYTSNEQCCPKQGAQKPIWQRASPPAQRVACMARAVKTVRLRNGQGVEQMLDVGRCGRGRATVGNEKTDRQQENLAIFTSCEDIVVNGGATKASTIV